MLATLLIPNGKFTMIHGKQPAMINNSGKKKKKSAKKIKPEDRPDPSHLLIFSTRTRPEPAGTVGFFGPTRPVENSIQC